MTANAAGGSRASLVLLLAVGQLLAVHAQRFRLGRLPAPVGARPSPRFSAAVQSFEGTDDVVLFGGRTAAGAGDDTWIYDSLGNEWTPVNTSDGPSARYDTLSAAVDFGDADGKYMYVIGGRAPDASVLQTSLMWSFQLSTRRWAEVSVTSSESAGGSTTDVLARASAAGGVTEQRSILISHGQTLSEVRSDAYSIAFTTPLEAVVQERVYGSIRTYNVGDPRALSAAASVVTRANELVVSGGCYQTGLCPNQDVWSFDLSQRQWRYLARGPSPRQFASMAVGLPSFGLAAIDARQTVILWGGLETSRQITRVDRASPLEIDMLDVRNRRWSRELAESGDAEALSKRYGASIVVVGESVANVTNSFRYLIFGGADEAGTPTDDVLRLTFNATRPPKLAATGVARVQGYVYVHGTLMLTSFAVLLPLGVLVARYLRSLSSSPKWFVVHACTQALGGVVAWVGLCFGVVGANDSPTHAHAIFGSIVMVLLTLQLLSGTSCVRPNPNAGFRRQVWSALHQVAGWSVFALGLFNCLIGMILLVLPVGTWVSFIVITTTLCVAGVALELRRLSRRDHKACRYLPEPDASLSPAKQKSDSSGL
jgi:hypothetical protein